MGFTPSYTHKSIYKSNPKFVKDLGDFLFNTAKDLINDYSITPKQSENSFFNSISGGSFSSKNLILNEDEGELDILQKRYNLLFNKRLMAPVYRNEEMPSIDSIFLRIQQLKFRTEIIYSIYHEQIEFLANLETLTNITGDDTSGNLRFHIDATEDYVLSLRRTDFLNIANEIIFCYKNLIKIINTYGINYTLTNSYLASIYKHLIPWSKIFENLEQFFWNIDEEHSIHTDIQQLVVQKSSLFDSKKNKYKALEHYKKALSLHSEGAEYKRIIKDMYILEDDFNDGLTHFYASLERSLINSGRIKRRIEDVRNM